jgi:SpoVK/Ycf46/Vps4 family AAA+-type ATPase
LFSVASQIAPSIIFIDKVDSILARRGSEYEHGTMRRIANEFMTHWDGLLSKPEERIVVLGATNMPFDLDEAAIRRFQRR